ncbi:hypothetical protein DFQ26_005543 [Actinomortierella ambigua]|nr:hypothetical protein DFQ26_005543 [Actinomortierella ambigua]
MIKNIGKFKQWTGEKIGKSQKTRLDGDFESLATQTDAKRAALDKLHDAAHAYQKAISKRVEGEDKYKGLAVETFGMCMSTKSYSLPEGTPYNMALQRMGDAHQKMAVAQQELITRFNDSYLDCLEKSQAEMKEYQALQKKLQSRRLDYDAKLSKVQKAKKEKPEWEEEMQAAKAKYEETREHVLAMMNQISESQDQHLFSLGTYYEAQLAYARKLVEILEAIPEDTFVQSPNGSRASLVNGANGGRKPSRQNSQEPEDDHRSVHSDDQASIHSTSRHPLDRAPSTNDIRRVHTASHVNSELSRSMSQLTPSAAQVRKNSGSGGGGGGGGGRTNGSLVPPLPPSRAPARPPQKQVRALYSFEATGEGELSIQKGDVIKIIEEIDEGWWEGELVDAHGVRHEGMFPSNYVEEIPISDSGYPKTKRQGSVNSNSSSDHGRYVDEDAAAYYERETEPSIQYEEPEEVVQPMAAARRAAPRPPPTRAPVAPQAVSNGSGLLQASANGSSITAPPPALARATPPPSRPTSTLVSRSSTIGSRVPPPPPPTRRALTGVGGNESFRQSGIFHPSPGQPTLASPPSLPGAGPSPPAQAATPSGNVMGGYIPRDYFSSQSTDASNAGVGPCRECGCNEFTANVFKRGSCNNCFHTH